jgi:transcriptional regulator with XRE-family HTH domain
LSPRNSDPASPGASSGRARERPDPADLGWKSVGDFIRAQRQLANLSLRQLADLANVSNPYLSQIERGLYRPSAEVMKSLAAALQISAETLYARAGLLDEAAEESCTVLEAIRLDNELTNEQKEALIGVYRGFLRR